METGKNRRLKQAKEEAQAEIEQYRLQREKEFKAKEAAVCFLAHSPTSLALSLGLLALRAALGRERVAGAVLPQVSSSDAQPRVVEKPVEMTQYLVYCISLTRTIDW